MTTHTPSRTQRVLRRGVARLRGADYEHSGIRVVRIELGWAGRTYAYKCRGNPQLGTVVEVDTPLTGVERRPVVGFGRQGYHGALKWARVVR